MDEMIEGIRTLKNVKYNPLDIDNIFIELPITRFETGDSINSPYLKNIKNMDARANSRLDSYNRPTRRNVGSFRHFGKSKKFGSMVMF